MVIATTNNDLRIRLTIIVLMLFGMGGWFAYDGWIKYPSANLEWAEENLPVKLESPATNPRITAAGVKSIKPGEPVAQIVAELGEPALRLPRELTFKGEDLHIIVHVDDGKIKDVSSRAVEGADLLRSGNPRVRKSALDELEVGMSVERLERRLGDPDSDEPPTLWYIGPAAFLKIPVTQGEAGEGIEFHENGERTEGDIRLQKIIAVGLFVIGAFFLAKAVREFRLRIVADEGGLQLGRKQLAWRDVTGLDTAIFDDKGWLDLKYQEGGKEKSFRLDSYYLNHFDALMQEIARHKGWAWPTGSGSKPEGEALPPEDQEASPAGPADERPADQA